MTTATPDNLSQISALINRVHEAADSDRNRARQAAVHSPWICFNTEDPIIWSHVFDIDINQFFSDPAFYLEYYLRAKLWRWEHFDDDDMPITLDVPAWLGWYCEYTFFDMPIVFTYRGVPRIRTDHPITRNPNLSLLRRPVDFHTSGWSQRMLKWHEDVAALAGDRLNVHYATQWNRGCLDLAMQLRGYENLVTDTSERPQFVHDLLKALVEERCRWYDGYHAHFGGTPSPVGIADDWINIPFITPTMFEDFLLPRYLDLEAYHNGLANIHSCGDQAPIQKYLLQVKSLQSLEVSPWTSLEASLRNIPQEKHLNVALHPNDVIYAGAQEMEDQLREIITMCEGRRYGIGTGGLSPATLSNDQFVERIRTWTGIARRLREQ